MKSLYLNILLGGGLLIAGLIIFKKFNNNTDSDISLVNNSTLKAQEAVANNMLKRKVK